jgi:hypothetical protein
MAISAQIESLQKRLNELNDVVSHESPKKNKNLCADFDQLCHDFIVLKKEYMNSDFLGYITSIENNLGELGSHFPRFKKTDLNVRGNYLLSTAKILPDLLIESGAFATSYLYSFPIGISIATGWAIIRVSYLCFSSKNNS